MTILPKSVLVVGSLADAFTAEFIDYMRAHASEATHIYVLWSAAANDGAVRRVNAKYFGNDSPVLKIFYGSAGNEALLQRIVDEHNVDVIFHFHHCTTEIDTTVVDSARRILSTETHFLEAVRKCATPPAIVAGFFADETSKVGSSLTEDGRLAGTFRASSLADANFGSAVALLHSYAISYRLNIQVAHLQVFKSAPNGRAFESLLELARGEKNSAPICSLQYSPPDSTKITEPAEKLAARFLLYGNADGELCTGVRTLLEARGAECALSRLRPETAPADALRDEILALAPSHLVLLPQAPPSVEDPAVYNAAGASNLLKNARDNLFAPLQLANICAQITGVHFTYANAHSLASLCQLAHLDSAAEFGTEDCYGVAKHYTDATLAFFERECFNAVLFESKNPSRDTVAQFLVGAALARRTGCATAPKM